MSMISGLIDKLNKSADEWNGSNMFELAHMCREAADTIWELRDSVHRERAEADKLRHDLEEANNQAEEVCAENAKLRELVTDTLMQPRDYCKKYGIEYESWNSANDHLDARMREMGIEVDA